MRFGAKALAAGHETYVQSKSVAQEIAMVGANAVAEKVAAHIPEVFDYSRIRRSFSLLDRTVVLFLLGKTQRTCREG